MRTGKPFMGDLYATPTGQTVEVLAVKDIDMVSLVESAAPVGATTVIAFRLLGAFTVHLAATTEVEDWVKIPGVD